MAKKVKSSNIRSRDDSKTYAFLATFLSIIGFIIALVSKKDDKYVMYYAKQSLVIFIIMVIVGIVNSILMWVPFLGWFIGTVLWIGTLILWVVSWINALSGQERAIPIVSDFAGKINL